MNSLFPTFKGCLLLSRAQFLGTYPSLAGHWEVSGMIGGVVAVASLVLDNQMNQWVVGLEPARAFYFHQQREVLTPNLPESPICKTRLKRGLEEWILRLCWRVKLRRGWFISRMAILTSLVLAQQLLMELQFTAGMCSGGSFSFAFWAAEVFLGCWAMLHLWQDPLTLLLTSAWYK